MTFPSHFELCESLQRHKISYEKKKRYLMSQHNLKKDIPVERNSMCIIWFLDDSAELRNIKRCSKQKDFHVFIYPYYLWTFLTPVILGHFPLRLLSLDISRQRFQWIRGDILAQVVIFHLCSIYIYSSSISVTSNLLNIHPDWSNGQSGRCHVISFCHMAHLFYILQEIFSSSRDISSSRDVSFQRYLVQGISSNYFQFKGVRNNLTDLEQVDKVDNTYLKPFCNNWKLEQEGGISILIRQ